MSQVRRLRLHFSGCALVMAGVTACGDSTTPPAGPSAFGAMPASIAHAERRAVGAICPVERIDGEMIRSAPPLRAGAIATFAGWSRVADPSNPVPSLVHMVLRPVGSKGASDLFLPAQREKRDELAAVQGMAMAGFIATGVLPAAPGRYQLLVFQGNEDWQAECDTGQTVSLEKLEAAPAGPPGIAR